MRIFFQTGKSAKQDTDRPDGQKIVKYVLDLLEKFFPAI